MTANLVKLVKCNLFRMNPQAKISSFFKPRCQITQAEPAVKKQRLSSSPDKKTKDPEDRENIPSTPPDEVTRSPKQGLSSSPVSPEQKQRMLGNKLQAQMKLVSKSTFGMTQEMGETWFQALQSEFSKPYFIKLSEFVNGERQKGTIFPPQNEVFSFTRHCDLNNVKVVILGQDPYHGPNQAHGLCFSVQKGIPPPPSLQNMYKTLQNDIEGFKHPGHGYLGGWAEQGVLLLNAVLTVRAHNANSHKDKGWEKYTDAVITHINKHMDSVVFMLWGSYAQKKGQCIKSDRHCILKSVHPSPLSAHRGFFECGHFSKCNDYLESKNKKPIDWTHLPLP